MSTGTLYFGGGGRGRVEGYLFSKTQHEAVKSRTKNVTLKTSFKTNGKKCVAFFFRFVSLVMSSTFVLTAKTIPNVIVRAQRKHWGEGSGCQL